MEDEAKLMRDKLTERFDRMMKVLFRQEGASLEIGILASEEAQDFIETHSFCPERIIPAGGKCLSLCASGWNVPTMYSPA